MVQQNQKIYHSSNRSVYGAQRAGHFNSHLPIVLTQSRPYCSMLGFGSFHAPKSVGGEAENAAKTLEKDWNLFRDKNTRNKKPRGVGTAENQVNGKSRTLVATTPQS